MWQNSQYHPAGSGWVRSKHGQPHPTRDPAFAPTRYREVVLTVLPQG